MTAAAATQRERQVGVKIEDVTKVYPTRGEPITALSQCSLEMRPGEFVSVVGPSGCGKSTLLLMVAGLIPKTSGTITIAETLRHMAEAPARRRLMLGMAGVPGLAKLAARLTRIG